MSHIPQRTPKDSDKPIVEALLKQGWSDCKIGQHFNVSKDTIRLRRITWGLVSGLITREESLKENISELWKNGYTVEEIAECLGVSLQVVYTKMRLYKIRELPRMGIDAPNMSMTELRQSFTDGLVDEDTVVLVTHNRLPKWALVPIEQYQDLVSGVYQELREEA